MIKKIIFGMVILVCIASAIWSVLNKRIFNFPEPPVVIPTPVLSQSPSASNVSQPTPQESSEPALTLSEVRKHSTKNSFYAVISNKVYDLTDWIGKHPGGPEAIEKLCGTDATESFSKKHGNQEKPQQTLANFLIGELVK